MLPVRSPLKGVSHNISLPYKHSIVSPSLFGDIKKLFRLACLISNSRCSRAHSNITDYYDDLKNQMLYDDKLKKWNTSDIRFFYL